MDINTLINSRVDKIYPRQEDLTKKLTEDKKLRVYLGVDPTGALQLHHTIALLKLRDFQLLGHHVILLIGSFTAMIGDPTGKSKSRVPLTKEQVLENAKNYKELAAKILDFENNPPEFVFNGEWLEKLTFKEVVDLASHFTVQQMIERDMFQERLKANLPISLHEFLYPLMQGYDSVSLDCDVEVGGTDQTFNMLAGRKLLSDYKNKEKYVVVVPLLTDENGKKTSTSDGTGIPLDLNNNDFYARVMSLPDAMIKNTFILCTDVSEDEISKSMADIANGKNPMDVKKLLARTLTEMHYGLEEANSAELNFKETVQEDNLPKEMPVWKVEPGLIEITDLLLITGLVDSKSDAKRMVTQGAVSVYKEETENKIDNPHTHIQKENGLVIRVGKRRYLRLEVA